VWYCLVWQCPVLSWLKREARRLLARDRIRLLHFTEAVLAVLGLIQPLLGPALGLHPLLLRKPALDIDQGSREGELSFPAGRVPESEPLQSVGIWLVSGEFGPFVGQFIPFDALVAWAPPDLGFDSWLFRSEGDVFPGHDRVFLAWFRIVGGHSPDGRLDVREDGGGVERTASGCRYSEGLAIAANSAT